MIGDFIVSQWFEAVVLVEAGGRVVFRVYGECVDSRLIGDFGGAGEGVEEKYAAESLLLVRLVNGQSRKMHGWNGESGEPPGVGQHLNVYAPDR